jgi:hypothetical protein
MMHLGQRNAPEPTFGRVPRNPARVHHLTLVPRTRARKPVKASQGDQKEGLRRCARRWHFLLPITVALASASLETDGAGTRQI